MLTISLKCIDYCFRLKLKEIKSILGSYLLFVEVGGVVFVGFNVVASSAEIRRSNDYAMIC